MKRNITANKWPLYFYGDTGRGKTYGAALVYAECSECLIAGLGPVFWPAARVIEDFIQYRFTSTHSTIRNSCRDARLVIIDDIIDRNMTDARCAALLDIINWREGKPLILTGNFAPERMTETRADGSRVIPDDRLISRILSGKSLRFQGPDMRLQGLEIENV